MSFTKIPIIESILIIGLPQKTISSLKQKSLNDLKKEYPNPFYGEILKNYESTYAKFHIDESRTKSIPQLAFPNGVIDLSDQGKMKKSYICFTLRGKKKRFYYLTCLSIPEQIKLNNDETIINKIGIVLISSYDIYECHKEILDYFYDVIYNYTKNLNNPKKLYYVSTGIGSSKKIEEFKILFFYFDFLLNSLILDSKQNINFCLCGLNTTSKKNIFCKLHIDKNIEMNQLLTLKENEITILLDKLNIDNLIQIYLCMLLEYNLVLIYENYLEINLIIESLIYLLYPLQEKLYFNIIYTPNSTEIRLIKEDIRLIIGVHSKSESLIDQFSSEPNTVIYSLVNKKFIKFPPPEEFPQIDQYLIKEIKSKLYYMYGEKLSINEMCFEDSEMKFIFDESICKRINTNLYFNLKLQVIFIEFFLKIIRSINHFIKFDLCSNSANLLKNNNDNSWVTSSMFNKEKFCKNNPFLDKFVTTELFNDFLKNYILHYSNNPRYIMIYNIINDFNHQQNINKYLKHFFMEQIKKKIISYYDFKYINLQKCFEDYLSLDIMKEEKNDGGILSILQFENLKGVSTQPIPTNINIINTNLNSSPNSPNKKHTSNNSSPQRFITTNNDHINSNLKSYQPYIINENKYVSNFELFTIYNLLVQGPVNTRSISKSIVFCNPPNINTNISPISSSVISGSYNNNYNSNLNTYGNNLNNNSINSINSFNLNQNTASSTVNRKYSNLTAMKRITRTDDNSRSKMNAKRNLSSDRKFNKFDSVSLMQYKVKNDPFGNSPNKNTNQNQNTNPNNQNIQNNQTSNQSNNQNQKKNPRISFLNYAAMKQTEGERIKSKLSTNYILGSSNSNKNLSSLLNKLNVISPKNGSRKGLNTNILEVNTKNSNNSLLDNSKNFGENEEEGEEVTEIRQPPGFFLGPAIKIFTEKKKLAAKLEKLPVLQGDNDEIDFFSGDDLE